MKAIDFFDLYTDGGLQVIPLYPRTKIPVGCRWNESWQLDRCRSYIEEHMDCNLGLLLGHIIDVEGDSDNANCLLNDLIGDYPHPVYQSLKSQHHLFLNPDPDLTAIRLNDVEFRANKHQSAIPPSVHESGSRYIWLSESKFPIPPMPEKLLQYYLRNKKKNHPKKGRLKPGHCRTRCNNCEKMFYIHKSRLTLEVKAFLELRILWQCHGCRPVDVRPACRRIRKQIKYSMRYKDRN